MADQRTEFAADRTVLANERTYAAWIRTGLAALVGWVAVEKLMFDILPSWSIRVIAVILLAVGACCFSPATWRYTHTNRRLRRQR